jgi:hypothetical protein
MNMGTTNERAIAAPIPTEDTRAFWEAANAGRFLVKRCRGCQQVHWYPRALCPFCFSSDTVWEQGSGRGTIYSFSIMRHAPQPFVVAFVTLQEGPTMLTNIVDCDVDAVAIGQAVEVVFKPTSGGAQRIPVFRPA